MIRNLLFHCYPIRATVWPWHVDQLIRYKEAWNGRKIVVIATDSATESAENVIAMLAPLGAEIFVTKNQSYLSEVYHFTEMLSLLESTKADEATFYAHAKGVTRMERVNWIRLWCDAMYRLNLGNPPAIDRMLATKKAVGAFRLIKGHPTSPWHYSGTFWWIRHDALFAPGWETVQQERFGVEAYPGQRVLLEDSVSLTEDNIIAEKLYNGWIDESMIQRWEKAL